MQKTTLLLWLINFCTIMSLNAMDLSQSIELKEVIIEQSEEETASLVNDLEVISSTKKGLENTNVIVERSDKETEEYFLDQLKGCLAYRDIDGANELIDEVALVKSTKKRNKILIQFQNFLFKQKTHIYPFIIQMKKWRVGIILASLAFAFIVYGCLQYLTFNPGPLGKNMPLLIGALPLVFLLCSGTDNIQLHRTLSNAEKASIRNYDIHCIEKCLLKKISKLYHVRRNPDKQNAKKIVRNVVNFFRGRPLYNAQNMIRDSIDHV